MRKKLVGKAIIVAVHLVAIVMLWAAFAVSIQMDCLRVSHFPHEIELSGVF